MNITIARRRGWRFPASAGLALLWIPALLSHSGRPAAESQPPPNRKIGPAQCAERAAILACGCGEKCACKTGCEEGKCGVPPKPASGAK
jgi:hypothetical protein